MPAVVAPWLSLADHSPPDTLGDADDELLDMLARNTRLGRCVLWDISSSFTSDHCASFKAHEVLVPRQQAPLPRRAQMAFLSVVRRRPNATQSTGRGVLIAVVSLIFEFAAPCKRRQCLVVKKILEPSLQ